MTFPLRLIRRGPSRKQTVARERIEDGITNRDPTPWEIYKNEAGYNKTEAGKAFARVLRAVASDPLCIPRKKR